LTNYEELIQEIATPRQYEAWKYYRAKMRRSEIAVKMGISEGRVSRLRQQLLKKIKKFYERA